VANPENESDARWIRPDPDVCAGRPKTVTVATGRGSEGERVRFASKGSPEQVRSAMPVAATGVLTGVSLASGEASHLAALDVRVLLERPPEKEGEEGRPLA
jgi:hypothetical protein